ncbi:hypothetical protein LXL04_022543 [Taraxacum kok-saghyz]
MATQQGAPSRPWFRLATMVRPPTPPPDQPPPPPPPAARPAFIRPAFSQTFRAPPAVPPPQTTATPPTVSPPRPTATSSPAKGVTPPTSPPPPPPPAARAIPPSPPSPKVTSSSTSRTSPLQQSRPPPPMSPPQPSYSPPTITRSPTPTNSPPKSIKPLEKNSPLSPPMRPVSHPPSPLALPSPQLKPEYEQKTMVVQETKEKPKSLDHGFNGDSRKHSGIWGSRNPKKPETSKKHSDSEDGGMRIITIAGENKGAVMELSPFGKKTHNFGDNPHRLHNPPAVASDGEKSGSDSDGKSKAGNKSKSPLMSAVMNSNVQGVNNSILYNCSTSHHDPGVHLSLSRKPIKFKDHTN